MSQPRIYWKGVRLGDMVDEGDALTLRHAKPQYQEAVGAESAHAHLMGPNAVFEASMAIALKRGFTAAEGSSAFWDRIRTLGVTLKRAMAYGGGVPQRGPLCFVRDPDGDAWGQQDSTVTSEAIVGTGTETISCVAVDPTWAAGQYVLVFEPANPYTKFEVVELVDADDVGGTIDAQFSQAYTTAAEVHRLEWYLPDSALDNDPDFGGLGTAQRGVRKGIRLVFSSVAEPVNGGLTT